MRLRWLVILGAMGFPIASGANASVFTDDLARCLVARTTSEDRTNIVRMMFYAAAANPAFSGVTNISEAQRRDGLRSAAAVYDRLVLVDCRTESVAAMRSDGAASIELAFQTLGQLAGRELMNSAEGLAVLNQLTDFMDLNRYDALMREAGVTPPARSRN